MIRVFQRRPGRDAELFAEAQALVDDGLDREFVLALYPEDADWLDQMLSTSGSIVETFAAEQPSYYFEASLKAKFLAAAEPQPQHEVTAPRVSASYPQLSPVRTMFASASVAVAAVVLGVATLGMVTADDAVPGDWNYAFKRGQERVEYALARGDGKVDVQIDHIEARVYEVQKQAAGGDVSESDINRVNTEIAKLLDLTQGKPLDEYRKTQLKNALEEASAVLNDVGGRNPQLAAQVDSAIDTVNTVATSAGLGTIGTVTAPTPEPTASPSEPPAASPTPEETPTPGEATPTAEISVTSQNQEPPSETAVP